MPTMIRLLFLLGLFGCTLAAVYQYPVKVGEKLELSVPQKGIHTWERIILRPEREVLQLRTNSKLFSGARVTKDGKLIINKVTLSDSGSYTSPDEKPPMTYHPDGSISAVGTSMINVIVE
ncbi:hypothetical protein PRIPAC_72275 [Pristionchus pacificus]|uniref:Uncharacterized protein n=1 Tax=Pristionchus pacificus TaxID=54126 RepID=A0A2A6C8S4_PRIPA|nr:hypothetical protein PRIPAC_72275 [Pristionchus pacificus]|eukprot:PDM74500.1 hypothetical protein PRIPAC_41856 [Pristionchus pacificus]